MINLSIDEADSKKSYDTDQLLKHKTFFEVVRDKLYFYCTFEYGILFLFVALAFSLAVYHFLGGKVQSLVPFSAVSSCDTYSEVYNLAPQSFSVEQHLLFVATTLNNGATQPGYALVNFTGQWSSCLRQSVDNNFHLNPEVDNNFQPLVLDVQQFRSGVVNASSSTNDGCFQLFCNFDYTCQAYVDTRKDFEDMISNAIFVNIPYNINDGLEVNDDGLYVANSQLIASIAGTDNSVTANCAISIAGFYVEILSVSNSVTSTGTYLCTQYTTSFQAVTSAISIALTAMGLCRLYLGSKSYLLKLSAST